MKGEAVNYLINRLAERDLIFLILCSALSAQFMFFLDLFVDYLIVIFKKDSVENFDSNEPKKEWIKYTLKIIIIIIIMLIVSYHRV